MKAFLLAAGRGTRLRPYTDRQPKCLMPIGSKPLLAIWLAHLERAGVQRVLLNLHHHAPQVEAFVRAYRTAGMLDITLAHEPQLLGSAGTLLRNRSFVQDDDDFWIIYADNLTNLALIPLLQAHAGFQPKGALLTMALFRAPDPRACGIAELDQQYRIVRFTEKPQEPASNLANAGIYVANREIFSYFPESGDFANAVMDFGTDVLPRLAGRMYGYEINAYLKDIGTVAAYHQALQEWPALAGNNRTCGSV